MSLKKYIAEAEARQNIPQAGDYFDIELEDGTLLETYIMQVDENVIVVDATPRMLAVLREWADLDGDASDVLFEGRFKQSMEAAAERMELADFVERFGHLFSPGEAEKFWKTTNGVEESNYDIDVADQDSGEYDYEGDMAKDDLYTIIRAARRLTGMLDDNENMPEWVQSKINKAADYVDTAADYIESNKERAEDEQGVAEADMDEAKYQGREVPLGKPMRGDVKKFKVYVRDPSSGNIKKVNFGHGGTSAKRAGQKTMKIRKSDPARRRSFRARHNCDNPGPRTKARYWSCRKW